MYVLEVPAPVESKSPSGGPSVARWYRGGTEPAFHKGRSVDSVVRPKFAVLTSETPNFVLRNELIQSKIKCERCL